MNVQVHEEHERKITILYLFYEGQHCDLNNNCLVSSAPGVIAIAEINEALNSSDYRQTLAALLLPTAKLTGVNPPTAKHYYDVLQYTKQLLCQVKMLFIQIFFSFIKL